MKTGWRAYGAPLRSSYKSILPRIRKSPRKYDRPPRPVGALPARVYAGETPKKYSFHPLRTYIIQLHPLPSRYPILLALLSMQSLVAASAISVSGPRRIDFDADWRFFKGEALGAEASAFDDSKWRQLNLPHDWAIEGPFDPNLNPHTGGLPFFGTGWYRKSFTVPENGKGKYFSIEFDGAMSNSTVWINGHELGGRPYGYIGFSFDLTPYLNFGANNVIAVRLKPEDRSSRWYPGAGIYRNVWIEITGPLHVARWGTYVT